MAAEFDKRGSRRGFAGYVAITARALFTYVPQRYTITTAEGCKVSRAILVTVANSAQFGNGARIAPRALLDDGLLDLVVVEERARWRTVCHVPRLFDGTVERIPGCSICHIERATIESDRADALSRGRGTGAGWEQGCGSASTPPRCASRSNERRLRGSRL